MWRCTNLFRIMAIESKMLHFQVASSPSLDNIPKPSFVCFWDMISLSCPDCPRVWDPSCFSLLNVGNGGVGCSAASWCSVAGSWQCTVTAKLFEYFIPKCLNEAVFFKNTYTQERRLAGSMGRRWGSCLKWSDLNVPLQFFVEFPFLFVLLRRSLSM